MHGSVYHYSRDNVLAYARYVKGRFSVYGYINFSKEIFVPIIVNANKGLLLDEDIKKCLAEIESEDFTIINSNLKRTSKHRVKAKRRSVVKIYNKLKQKKF